MVWFGYQGNASPYENNSEEDEPSSCIDSSEDDCSDHKSQKGEGQDKVTPLLKVAAKDKKVVDCMALPHWNDHPDPFSLCIVVV